MPGRSWLIGRGVASTVLMAALLAGCGAGTGGSGPDATITVSAASSLTEAYQQLGTGFEARHPGTRVRFNFGSSTTLARQIAEGAPADVIATADEQTAAGLHDDGDLAGAPVPFATNRLVIATPPGNPAGIEGLADLPDAGVVALCAADAPCGRFAARALDRAGVALPEGRVTRAPDAKATLRAVSDGDARAAVVYATDARAAGDAVTAVAIPADQNVTAVYPIAVVAGADDAARAFVDYVLGAAGQAVLRDHGFGPPP